MGQRASSPAAVSTEAFGIVPSAPRKSIGGGRRIQQSAQDVDPPSRKERLAVCAPLLSEIRSWLFVAGHRVQWPQQPHCLVNLASEVPFEPVNPPPANIRHVLTLALRDGATQEIVPFLPRVLDAVQTARSAKDNIIVLCQQGVSRSCATAIAILMCRESLSYEQAFAQVKAARDVCSPNAGFICQLMELHAQRLDPAKRPQVFRYVPHALHDLTTKVLKPCWFSPHTRIHAPPSHVQRRSSCIYLYPVDSLMAYLWRGQDAKEADVALATQDFHKWYLHLWSEPNLPNIVVQWEGRESTAFLAWIQSSRSEGAILVDYDDVAWSTPSLVHQDEDTTASAGSSLHPLPSNAKPQFRVMESVDDESWELLRDYDSSDLLPHLVGWLHVPGDCDYIWIGDACDSNWTDEDLVERVQRDASVSAGPVKVVRGKEESDEFWTAFELGY
ncbi:hypothetical protein H310_06351 [Aphanomyces invadans]|uniref:Tyrosine specific protein phosphatases domain-containing protein n=1 Tax=Aphanomyces invadans TaxID=157072 RepID=A0A024U779_9STRA|nr:hypothetical protein H310_06351 [Aphanomyces invadans]ETW01747.1 hypothetical protein H310_06351 [Aphanomyces invadans]|eukprot:XP_008869595.1 hypothetical protein H310_06351 [Aphanomyces invadans]